MFTAIVIGAAVIIPLAVVYRSRKKDQAVSYANRGAFMRDLNKDIGKKKR